MGVPWRQPSGSGFLTQYLFDIWLCWLSKSLRSVSGDDDGLCCAVLCRTEMEAWVESVRRMVHWTLETTMTTKVWRRRKWGGMKMSQQARWSRQRSVPKNRTKNVGRSLRYVESEAVSNRGAGRGSQHWPDRLGPVVEWERGWGEIYVWMYS